MWKVSLQNLAFFNWKKITLLLQKWLHTSIAPSCSVSKHHGGDVASYPQLADEEAGVLQAHVGLLFDNLLDGLEDIPGHCDIPTHIDVSSLLLQVPVHSLWQLLAQRVLHIFLKGDKWWICVGKSRVKTLWEAESGEHRQKYKEYGTPE